MKTRRVGIAETIKEAITTPRADHDCICTNHTIIVHIFSSGHKTTANIKLEYAALKAPSAIRD